MGVRGHIIEMENTFPILFLIRLAILTQAVSLAVKQDVILLRNKLVLV